MATTLNSVLSKMGETSITTANELLIIDPDTRQISVPGIELVFGVQYDDSTDRKYFQCPRYVGNNLDLASCFIRVNYRNSNGEMDCYLVDDVTVDGDYVTFSWLVSQKVLLYKGQVKFLVCAVGPDLKMKWHTTLATGISLEGQEPDGAAIKEGTADVVAQLIAMVEQQTTAVEEVGAEWVRNVQSEGTDQIIAVQTAAQEAQTASVAEIEAKGVNVRESIPDDYTALSEAVDTLNRNRGAAIVCEAAGSAITVNDASDMAIQGMRIFGRSTQDGTPTPDAPVEIKSVVEPVVMVCGKNLLGGNVLADSIVGKMNGTKDESAGTVNFYCTYTSQKILFDQFKPDTMYTFIFKGWNTYGDGTNLYVQYTDGTLDYLTFSESKTESTALLKTDQNKSILHFSGTYYSGMTYLRYNECGVFEGDIDVSEFEPYSGQTFELTHTLPGIPVTSGGNYTDSDGQQWICDEVDLERGVYVQRVCVTAPVFTHVGTMNNGNAYSVSGLPLDKIQANVGILCNKAKVIYDTTRANDGECYETASVIVFVGLPQDTAQTFNEKYGSAELMYVLATPIETALSETEIAAYRALHSNYPNTTILNDAGAHMVVKYAADTKLYIDNKLVALVAANN